MANFKYMNEINSLLSMDGPITKGPMPRWQKKVLENANTNISINSSKNKSILSSSVNTSCTSKTPTERNGSDVVSTGAAAPKTKKTPSKTPSKNRSPSRMTSHTPNKGARTPNADRFIPVRNTSNFEFGHFKMNQGEENEVSSPSQKEMQRIMSENLHGNDISKQKILAYQNKAPAPPEGFQNPLRVIYTQTKTPASAKSSSRYVPQAPDRILDAPDIVDDYYLNLMDWNSNNVLAVALGARVFLWNAGTGTTDQLLELEGNDHVCSVSWIQEGDFLAVGTTMGCVELWDCARRKRLRVMEGHSARVGSLAWNAHVLSSGSRSGQIVHHDVRQRDHNVLTLDAHSQEVCGLRWSPDQRYLASGGNDNVLNVWSAAAGGAHHSQAQALHSFTQHQAAVKALAWCPWKPSVLASGGGTADRCIRFWNVNTGTCLNTVDTRSQVCALLWSTTYSELVSGHGFANNQLIIWKYPLMNKVAELTGHTARVLHLTMSPDGSVVLSAGADETLRFWKCFAPDPLKKKEPNHTGSAATKSASILRPSIR